MNRVTISILCFTLAACASSVKDSGSSSSRSKIDDQGCQTALGYIANGAATFGYMESNPAPGIPCVGGAIVCHNGVPSGPFTQPFCNETPLPTPASPAIPTVPAE